MTGFDYYYGAEAEQFSFYRIPRQLIKDERFKGLSSDAKLLYGLMLDRMSMSMKNGWLDAENRVYIVYTIDNILNDFNCAKATGIKILKELENINLIEKKKRGRGQPDIIYVKNFITCVSKNNQNVISEDSISSSQEVQKLNLKKFKNYTSRSSKIEPQEVQNLNPNYNNNNYTEYNYINPINLSKTEDTSVKQDRLIDGIDTIDEDNETNAYMQVIKDNIQYDYHMAYDQPDTKSLYDELYNVICEVVCVKRKYIKIGGTDYPYELVKSKFLKLNGGHLEYVIQCMKSMTKEILNIKAYLITALYNAPSTMNHYYQQKVQHDLFGVP